MKYLLLLLLLPQVAAAQNFEIGAFGGFNFHSRPRNNQATLEDKSQPGYAFGLKAALNLPKAQIGLGVETVEIKEYNYNIQYYTTRQYNYIAKPLTAPYLFYNLTHANPNGYLFLGVMAGPTVASVGVNSITYNGPNGSVSGYSTAYNSTIGIIAGAQAGFVIKLDKRLGISGEIGMRYAAYDYKPVDNSSGQDDPYKYHYFYFPVTAGLRYRI